MPDLTCEHCQRPIADVFATDPEARRHTTCPPGTCANCGTERPYTELRVADLGGVGEDIPDLFACTDVVACQIRAGERDPEDLPQGYR